MSPVIMVRAVCLHRSAVLAPASRCQLCLALPLALGLPLPLHFLPSLSPTLPAPGPALASLLLPLLLPSPLLRLLLALGTASFAPHPRPSRLYRSTSITTLILLSSSRKAFLLLLDPARTALLPSASSAHGLSPASIPSLVLTCPLRYSFDVPRHVVLQISLSLLHGRRQRVQRVGLGLRVVPYLRVLRPGLGLRVVPCLRVLRAWSLHLLASSSRALPATARARVEA